MNQMPLRGPWEPLSPSSKVVPPRVTRGRGTGRRWEQCGRLAVPQNRSAEPWGSRRTRSGFISASRVVCGVVARTASKLRPSHF